MSMSFSVARRTTSGRPHYKVVASAKCGVCWHHSWKRVINSASIKLWQRAGLVLLPAYYLSTASRISFRAVPSDSICKHNLKFFPVAGKQQKSWPNSPVQHHSHIIQQALKPILERFDFVKLSGFSRRVSLQQSLLILQEPPIMIKNAESFSVRAFHDNPPPSLA